MPKLEYPAFFGEDGLKGMKCTEEIANREVFLYVPYKMVINEESISTNSFVQSVIRAHPKVFEDKDLNYYGRLKLTMGLIY